jgi:metal-dependent amidase/aminoacylase/carboxypeptidase family protein
VPSAFLWLGQGSGTAAAPGAAPLDTALSLHHPRFAVDEGVFPTGVALHAHLAAMSLWHLAETPRTSL